MVQEKGSRYPTQLSDDDPALANFILNAQGNIVAKNLHGEALKTFVENYQSHELYLVQNVKRHSGTSE